MNKKRIILLSFIFLLLCSGVASAQLGRPGTILPLKLDNYSIRADMILVGKLLEPTHVRWVLKNPAGEDVFFVEDQITTIVRRDESWKGVTWVISVDSGTMKIPAFPMEGKWTLTVIISQKAFGRFDVISTQREMYSVDVRDNLIDSIQAPFYFMIGGPLGFTSWAVTIPSILIMSIPLIVFIVIFLNVKALLGKKRGGK